MTTAILDGRGDLPRVKRRRVYSGDTVAGAPTVASAATASTTTIGVVFSENIVTTATAAGSVWTVREDGVDLPVTSVSIATTTATLTVGATMSAGTTIMVSYDSSRANAGIRALDDEAHVATITNQSVTNNIV